MKFIAIQNMCEICGKRKAGKGHADHTICSKIKQKTGLFKSKDPTPSRQVSMSRGYEFMTKLMHSRYEKLGDGT